MNLALVDKKCIHCGLKLSRFEFEEKSSLCIDCYHEEYTAKVTPLASQPTRLRNKRWFIK
ncbi:hypothetical protein [Ammoniphilus sp. YIM 78166]|uniref:hypothetical protein n=1 Tax=Ammoniphilus sp. YIM 78166 TaxID=1644106 RepID=UPI001070319B|nr:hypothetical protein [Ammoniphilus sp. YIM 78166]